MLILVEVQQQFLVVCPGGGIPAGRSTLLMIGGQGFNSLWTQTQTGRSVSAQDTDKDGRPHLKPRQSCKNHLQVKSEQTNSLECRRDSELFLKVISRFFY